MELTRLQREIIADAAMAARGSDSLYGGSRCLRTAWALQQESREPQPTGTSRPSRRSIGPGLPIWMGGATGGWGIPFPLATASSPWSAKTAIRTKQSGLHKIRHGDNRNRRWN